MVGSITVVASLGYLKVVWAAGLTLGDSLLPKTVMGLMAAHRMLVVQCHLVLVAASQVLDSGRPVALPMWLAVGRSAGSDCCQRWVRHDS
mgnify:CR=1 FL=1